MYIYLIYLISFINGKPSLENKATISIDFFSKTFQLSDGSIVKCVISDTSGTEIYRAINSTYYKAANAVLLVYDISQRESFEEIEDFYCQNIKNICQKDIPIILLGNKVDLEEKGLRKVKTEEGIKLALKENYAFKETSCEKNENVVDAFEALIELWSLEENRKNKDKSDNNRNNKNDSNKKKNKSKNKEKASGKSLNLSIKDKKNNKENYCCV